MDIKNESWQTVYLPECTYYIESLLIGRKEKNVICLHLKDM